MSKHVLILPCSEAKALEPTTAYNLYKGKGYLGVVKSRGSEKQVNRAFRIGILSAKHGLVDGSQWLSPYEQKLTRERAVEMASSQLLKRNARAWWRSLDLNQPVTIVLPKAYRDLLIELLGPTLEEARQITWAEGGIGKQRGCLSAAVKAGLDAAQQWSEKQQCLVTTTGAQCRVVAELTVAVGDWVRLWVSGVRPNAQYSNLARIKSIRDYGSGDIEIETSEGNTCTFGVGLGLSEKHKEEITEKWDKGCHSMNDTRLYLSYQEMKATQALCADEPCFEEKSMVIEPLYRAPEWSAIQAKGVRNRDWFGMDRKARLYWRAEREDRPLGDWNGPFTTLIDVNNFRSEYRIECNLA